MNHIIILIKGINQLLTNRDNRIQSELYIVQITLSYRLDGNH
jgi:hypothetical protein